jgi:exodeoxyribonuclease V gamma subunit
VLEDALFAGLSSEVGDMLAEAALRNIAPGIAELRPVDVAVADGTRIVGTVPLTLAPPRAGSGRILFNRPKDAYRLEAWLDLMMLVGSEPTTAWHAVVVTRAEGKKQPLKPIELVAVAAPDLRAQAVDALGLVVDLYRKGLTEPLPLFAAYSPAVHSGKSPDDKWRNHRGGGDGTRPAVRLVFGDVDVRYARHLWGTVDATSELVP